MKMGVQLMRGRSAPNAAAAMFLLTDGHANRGQRDAPGILRSCGVSSGALMDFPVDTFGYGNDHNAGMLSNLSNQMGGSYYYVEGVKTVAKILATVTAGLMTTVGQRLKLTVNPASGIQIVDSIPRKAI